MKRYIRTTTQVDGIEDMIIDEFGSSNPSPGCTFIAQDGTYINIYPKIDTHEDLCYWVDDQFDEPVIDNPDESYFTEEYNWIRLRTPPELMIVHLPYDRPASKQWWALEDWLLYCEEHYPGGHELNLLVDQGRHMVPVQEQIDFFGSEVFTEDIMNLLKRYYATRRFN